jgi:oligopeptide transport system ATP-binding protein
MAVNLLEVSDLSVRFYPGQSAVRAVEAADLTLSPGRVLGIVGESGSGKSTILRAICGLVRPPGRVVSGSVRFDGVDLLRESPRAMQARRGVDLGMIFQDATTSLNPVFTIGNQIREVLRVKAGLSWSASRKEAVRLLDRVGIPDASGRVRAYPHELSGGMRQRAMIALAIATRPRLLLADEPTTALDVTTQEQVLELLYELQRELGMAMILVTHDVGVVAQLANDLVVMYGGMIVERGSTDRVIARPRHPYTKGLLEAMPRLAADFTPKPIGGQPPDLASLPAGCPFRPRCPVAQPACESLQMREESKKQCACPYADSHHPIQRWSHAAI